MAKVELKLDWCSHEAAKYAVEKWHYSHCMPAEKTVKTGVWESGIFIGAVIFSRGANNTLGSPYGLKQTECCELTRVALHKHQTAVSRIVAIAIKMLLKSSPDLRLIISFADPEQSHVGAIYQAGNWVYVGKTNSADEYIVRGKRMHGRSMRSLYGTHVGKDFIQIVKGSSKYRYLFPLDDDMRKQIAPLAKPYPKRQHADEATQDATGDQPVKGRAELTRPLQKLAE